MSDIDLTGDIETAINSAFDNGERIAVGYIDEDGYPAVSFRGSTQVYGTDQIALWARNPDTGLAKSIADRPKVSLVYFGPQSAGPMFLSVRGQARVDPSANDAVYSRMPEAERGHDAEKKGVAVVVDIDSVRGFADGAPFQQGG